MLDFNGQLSIAAGGAAFDNLDDLTKEGTKRLVHMSTVSPDQIILLLLFCLLYCPNLEFFP